MQFVQPRPYLKTQIATAKEKYNILLARERHDWIYDLFIILQLVLEGRNIFMGYHHSSEETDEAFDENLCLKTGDLGKVDKDGFYYITGKLLAFDLCIY